MKKIFLLFWIVVLIMLCGCNNHDEAETEEELSTSSETGNESLFASLPDEYNKEMPGETACVLELNINPHFVIYIDEKGTVLKVSAANQDAADVLSGVTDVSGKPFREAMVKLLSLSYDKGYLKDGGQASISAYLPEDISRLPNLFSQFCQACLDVSSEKNISFSNECGIAAGPEPSWDPNEFAQEPSEGTKESSSAEASQEEQENIPGVDMSRVQSIERDADGRVVRVEEKADGGMVITKEFDQDGHCVKESFTVVNEVESDEIEIFYDTDGRRTMERHARTFSDGSKENSKTEYNADGSFIVRWTSDSPKQDGISGMEKYLSDGTISESSITLRNGMHEDDTYYPGGQLHTAHRYGPFGDGTYTYSEAGEYLAWDGLTNDGYHSHTTFNADGTYTTEVDKPDGKEVITGLTADYGNGQ